MKPKTCQFYSRIETLKDKILSHLFIEGIYISESNSITHPTTQLKFNDFLGLNTIITGESERGKTYLTACFLIHILNNVLNKLKPVKIFVIDMAPHRFMKKDLSIGGKIIDFLQQPPPSPYFTYIDIQNIIPPRCNSKTAEEVIQLARRNYDNIINPLNQIYSELKEQKKSKNKNLTQNIVIINDLSLFLHYGSPKNILKFIKLKNSGLKITLFMNSYEGKALVEDHGSGITEKEKNDVRLIKNKCDLSIQLI